MTGPANRGKLAEALFKKACVARAGKSDFAWHRFPDAHGGSKVPTPCDFMFMQFKQLYMLEVKQVDHEYRLPYANVDPAQIARMRLWQAAGAKAHVLIYFSPIGAWRIRDVDWFLNRPLKTEAGKAVGSWSFKDESTCTLDEAIHILL